MSLIKINQTVEYLSHGSGMRTFRGRVRDVHDGRAVIMHDNEPKLVTVRCDRLVIVPPGRSRFAGASA